MVYIVRANPRGGHKLIPNRFPLHQDQNGNFGYLIGYSETGDKLLCPINLAEQFANKFADEIHATKILLKKCKYTAEKEPLKIRFVKWLLGKKKYAELTEQEEED